MRKSLLPAFVALAAISSGAWAGTLTSGITGVSVQHTVVGTQHWYDFTVHNFSNLNNPSWDVLVGEFVVDGVGVPRGVDAINWAAPSGWYVSETGWKKKCDTIGYNDGTGSPYANKNAIAPGETIGGFRLCFNQDLGDVTRAFDFQTHVYAVKPVSNPTDATTYQKTTVKLSNSCSGSAAYTWWDKSKDVIIPNPNPNPQPQVPEASSMMLGLMGLTGPIGYALSKRKRA